MDENEIIFSGPPTTAKFDEKESFGSFILRKLESLDPDTISHIHAETGEVMTNKEFLKLSKKVASGLQNIGVSVGDIVVLFGENTFRISAVATASILLNAPFAPLDPSLRKFELKNILKNYQPKFVFCNKNQAEDIYSALKTLQLEVPIILLDNEKSDDSHFLGFEIILDCEEKPLVIKDVKDASKELAFVVPSSGSTGIPKGVTFSHTSAINICVKTMTDSAGREGALFMQTSHLFWISGMFSLIFSYLGTRRVFLDTLDTENILKTIKKYKPAITFLSPSELASIVKYPNLEPDALASLICIVVGGGPLHQFIVDEFKKKLSHVPMLMHAYGLTENAGGVSHYVPGMDILSVGVLESGVKLKIVDIESEKSLGEEEIGEIRLKHPYQTLGYLGNPEATKGAFDSKGWLKTGDLGYMKGKALYITGRAKCLIKYRNLQISPMEIEHLLIGLDGISDVAVDGIPNQEDQYHAAALVVLKPGTSITEDDIHKYMEENMSAHHKLRGGVFFVESIPRTVHKKVKRKDVNELVLQLHNTKITS